MFTPGGFKTQDHSSSCSSTFEKTKGSTCSVIDTTYDRLIRIYDKWISTSYTSGYLQDLH